MTANGPTPDPPPTAWLDGPAAGEAAPAISAYYDDVAAHLRVPFLGPFWRSLTFEPSLVESLWAALSALLSTRAFEREAVALRRAALIDEAVTMPSHQAFKADLVRAEVDFEMRERIGNYNAAVHYALPKTLLAATWLETSPVTSSAPPAPSEALPPGVAAGAVAVTPLPPQARRGRVAELLEEIPRVHGHQLTDEYFLALGRLPDYLNAAWNAIRPIVRDEPYNERVGGIVDLAVAGVARLPAPPVGFHENLARHAEAARLRAVLAYFSHRHLPDILLDVAIIKGLTDGPERAQWSPFDLTD